MKKTSIYMAAALASSSAFAVTSITNANFGAAVTDVAANEEYRIVSDITLGNTNGTVQDTEYILEGFTFVEPGVTLTIEPGTIVRGQPFENATNVGSLIVSRGGEINAVGNANNPIIFTTAADASRGRYAPGDTFLDADPANNPLPPRAAPTAEAESNVGLWGAVTLLGYAPTNLGTEANGTAGEGLIEGFSSSGEETTYGGNLVNDSSGVMEYVSIRHTGRAISEGDEQQGLTLGGVGAGTKLENIDIYCSQDDGVEIFGGTVNLKNIMVSYVNDDAIDLDQGYTGNIQFAFVLASNLANTDGLITTDKTGEWDGADGDNVNDPNPGDNALGDTSGKLSITGQPFSNPTLYNLTIFAENAGGLLRCRNSFGGNVYNSIFYLAPDGGFRIDDSYSTNAELESYASVNPQAQSENGTLNFAGNIFLGEGSDASTSIANDAWAEAAMTNDTSLALNAANNVLADNATDIGFGFNSGDGINAQETLNGVCPVPAGFLNQTSGTNVPVAGAFFDDVSYQGAFPAIPNRELWTTGWTAMNLRGILVDSGDDTVQ